MKFKSLSFHVTELVGMRSFENLAKTSVVLSSSEAEDVGFHSEVHGSLLHPGGADD